MFKSTSYHDCGSCLLFLFIWCGFGTFFLRLFWISLLPLWIDRWGICSRLSSVSLTRRTRVQTRPPCRSLSSGSPITFNQRLKESTSHSKYTPRAHRIFVYFAWPQNNVSKASGTKKLKAKEQFYWLSFNQTQSSHNSHSERKKDHKKPIRTQGKRMRATHNIVTRPPS